LPRHQCRRERQAETQGLRRRRGRRIASITSVQSHDGGEQHRPGKEEEARLLAQALLDSQARLTAQFGEALVGAREPELQRVTQLGEPLVGARETQFHLVAQLAHLTLARVHRFEHSFQVTGCLCPKRFLELSVQSR
jgi:hypothetical protein